jgi:hypothetical protein
MRTIAALGLIFTYHFPSLPCTQQLLKKGGFIGIADFFLKGNYDDCLSPLFRRVRAVESLLHKNWYVLLVVWFMRCCLCVLRML